MKKIFYIIIGITLFISCLKEEKPDESYFWSPLTVLERNDGSIKLYLIDPRPFTEYATIPSDPETFEIYYSLDGETFTMHTSMQASIGDVVIDQLTNGQPYYVFVKSMKSGLKSVYSDTLMTIPTASEQPEQMFGNLLYTMRNVVISYDQQYLAGKSDDLNGWNLLSIDLGTNMVRTVDEVAFRPNWSPVDNKMVYISEVLTSYAAYPDQLRLYNAETYEDTLLLEIDYNDYYAMAPLFTSDAEKIIYLSSEDNEAANMYDLWEIDLETYTTTRLTTYNNNSDFYFQGTLSLSPDDTEVYFDVINADTEQYDIYKYNMNTELAEPFISSGWRDFDPSLSPDGTKLAFVSTRSGTDEIWLYDITGDAYKQITGGPGYGFDSRYSYIQWLGNSEILVSLYQNNKIKIYRIDVEV